MERGTGFYTQCNSDGSSDTDERHRAFCWRTLRPIHFSITKMNQAVPRNLYQDLSHVKGRLYEYLDHNNFDGVEVIREYAKVHQGEMALMPVVFTSNVV